MIVVFEDEAGRFYCGACSGEPVDEPYAHSATDHEGDEVSIAPAHDGLVPADEVVGELVWYRDSVRDSDQFGVAGVAGVLVARDDECSVRSPVDELSWRRGVGEYVAMQVLLLAKERIRARLSG